MMTGPVPTNHVHIYNLDSGAWTTTYLDQAGASLKKGSIDMTVSSDVRSIWST